MIKDTIYILAQCVAFATFIMCVGCISFLFGAGLAADATSYSVWNDAPFTHARIALAYGIGVIAVSGGIIMALQNKR